MGRCVTNPDADIAQLVASLKCGIVVAAAGCGKTEQIARATQIAEGRRLILTHTHAGVDALRARLKTHKVSSEKFRVDTIAGWCLRYAASFPKRSSLTCANPRSDKEWNAVYEAAARLIQSGAVKGVLASSYAGVFVDEYQDCSGLQHQVIKAIAGYLPVCVFGDPLQATGRLGRRRISRLREGRKIDHAMAMEECRESRAGRVASECALHSRANRHHRLDESSRMCEVGRSS